MWIIFSTYQQIIHNPQKWLVINKKVCYNNKDVKWRK